MKKKMSLLIALLLSLSLGLAGCTNVQPARPAEGPAPVAAAAAEEAAPAEDAAEAEEAVAEEAAEAENAEKAEEGAEAEDAEKAEEGAEAEDAEKAEEGAEAEDAEKAEEGAEAEDAEKAEEGAEAEDAEKAEEGAEAEGVSGEFSGTAQGIGGDVVVTITLDNGVITDVKAVGENETQGIGSVALEQMPPEMVAGNTINVDAIATATVTSNAILEAAALALQEAGLDPEDYMEAAEVSAEPGEDVELETDIVIIGAGGAGMTAAIVAADSGMDVIVVESQPLVGGNSVRSTGGMNAAETPYQDENEFGEEAGVEKMLKTAADSWADNETITALAKTVQEQWDAYQKEPDGYFDSFELFELDTMIGGSGINDPELVKALVENSDVAIDWLDSIGAELHNVSSFGGASVKRIHRPVNEEGKVVSVGAYIIPILQSNMEERGVELMLNTTAEKILMEDGKAIGIEASAKDGSKVTVYADAVIIASGGFGANNAMIAELNPDLDGYITTNAAGIQGQGIVMAQEVGAATVDMDQIQLHPTVHVADDGSANLITEGLRGDGAILVNQEGLRFFDEVSTRDKVSNAENQQTGGYAWLIVDQKMYDASAVIQGYISKGWAVTGETAEELAEQMDIDPEALAQTIETWNGYVEAKEDPEFGRTSFANILEGPFYALTVQPGVHHTMGGLKINPNAEVLDEDGNVIPGLFAAGEVTGGVHGGNRLGGNAVADFVVFGRISGINASVYVDENAAEAEEEAEPADKEAEAETPAEDKADEKAEAPAEDKADEKAEAPAEEKADEKAEAPAEEKADEKAEAPAEDKAEKEAEAPAEEKAEEEAEAPAEDDAAKK